MMSQPFWKSFLKTLIANVTRARSAAVHWRYHFFQTSWISNLFVASLALFLLIAEPALAQSIDLSPIQSLLQGIVDALTGPLGVVIATLAVLGVFLSWFFNIIDLRQALWVLVGIAGVAAAPTIVAAVFAGG
ncbi:Type IV secretion system protein virB2 (plasmid) [Sulfitobacter pontiacus]|uniref:Type IV secretion system protein virB2 n=1 Tax=Sulfitobacter pontiacus TaxID=60137 RepID=A0AAX3AEN3_9RHOB|nr:Type IV secretion system protein virB2 [Sulfitobacter pontiacus]